MLETLTIEEIREKFKEEIKAYVLANPDNYSDYLAEDGTLDDDLFEAGYSDGFGEGNVVYWADYCGARLPSFEDIASGNLGDGHASWVVMRYIPTDQLVGWEGYYSSWDSNTWEDTELKFMRPSTSFVVYVAE